MATLGQVLVADAAVGRRISATAIVAGLLVGGAECLFFAFALLRLPAQLLVWQWFGWAATGILDVVAMTLVVAAPLLAGWAIALMLRRRQRRAAWWRIGLAGPSLLVASVLGVVIASTLEPLGVQSGEPQRLLLVFRVAFVLASATAALVCTYSVALLLGARNALRIALVTAAATGATYLVFGLLIDPLPGWHVGGGDKAMVRVAMLGNLLAGSIGGTTAFRLLSIGLRHTMGRR